MPQETTHMEHWSEIPAERLSGNGYRNIEQGWKNDTQPHNNEVLIFRVEGTDVESVADGPLAVQHPRDVTGENIHFFDSLDAAESFATRFMADNPTLN